MKRIITGILLLLLLASVAIWAQTGHSVTLSWPLYVQGTGDQAVGLNIGRTTTAGGTNYTIINTTLIPVTTLTYTDTLVTSGTSYYYSSNAQDANGNVSTWSAQIGPVTIPGNPAVPPKLTFVVH